MFIIKPTNHEDWASALFILSYYHVVMSIFSNGDNTNGMWIRVEKEYNEYEQLDSKEEEQLRLAEMAFQGNWHTESHSVCDVCRDDEISVCVDCDIRYSCDDSRDDCQLKNIPPTCGHLVFTKPIKPAF